MFLFVDEQISKEILSIGGSNIVVKTVGNFYRQAFFYAKRCYNVTKIFLIFALQQYTISINYVRILNVNILGFFEITKGRFDMDVDSFVKQLSVAQKILFSHGKGSWHTNSVNGMPAVTMADGPHGLRKQVGAEINDSKMATCFPTGSALASSWNRATVRQVAEAIADEAVAEDVSLLLGPSVNIKRNPLCGRNFEYFSEDPLLAGELAAEYVNAVQNAGVGCSVKHFAVNSRETDRMTTDSVVDERALREIYLAPFERVVKQARPYTVMAAYNKVNGESCAHNKRLLTDVLRGEWGFDGAVVSDWGACYDLPKAYRAGVDLQMPDGGKFHEKLVSKALQNGELDEESLDRACLNVAKLVQKCSVPKQKTVVSEAKHHLLSRKAAADCAVLLKNNGILPLRKDSRVLVVGELAEKPRFQGAGSSHVNAKCRSFLQILTENGVEYTYAKGYNVKGDKVDEHLQFEAARLALKYDTVLFFGGLTDDSEGEGFDRSHLEIPNCQRSLLSVVSQHNPNVVFVAVGGAPFVCPWLYQVKALLQMHLGGEAVTEAAFDLIFGNVSPCGRLAESYPLRLEDVPCYNNVGQDERADEHRESVFVGYRYYNSFDVPVQFPFGYGLSYCLFVYTDMTAVPAQDGYDVTVTVNNYGPMGASEVVELFVDNCDCGYFRPKRQLAAFDKVFVPSGGSVKVALHVDNRAFSVFADGKFRVVKGKYKLCICKDVETVTLSQTVEVAGETLKGQDRKNYPAYYPRKSSAKKASDEPREPLQIESEQFYALAQYRPSRYVAPKRGEYTLTSTLGEMAPNVGMVRMLLRYVRKYAIKHSPTKTADDPVAKMTYLSALSTPLISLMSVGGVKSKYVMYLLYKGNKKPFKALAALRGKIFD